MCGCLSMSVYVCLYEGKRQIMYVNRGREVSHNMLLPPKLLKSASRRNESLERIRLYSTRA